MEPRARQASIDNYRALYARYGRGPETAQASAEGQLFRFAKLGEVGDLAGQSVIDIGCGLGDLYPYLRTRFGTIDYLGIDVVPELVRGAALLYPDARFLCRDLLEGPLPERADWVLMSMLFNNALPHDAERFLREMVAAGFDLCRKGMAFNFISTYVNFRDSDLAYHDPVPILDFILRTLTPKVTLHHHYERCDVAFYLYR